MEKRIYNIEKMRGVDITSSPINVASNRASYMVNMINEGGVNKKRHGWQDIAWFEHSGEKLPINGIYDYNGDRIVHAGTHFYWCDDSFSIILELQVADGVTVTSTKSKGYLKNGKLWIAQAGDYLVCDLEAEEPVIEAVMNSVYTYVPTTSIGILPRFSPTEETSGSEYRGERYQGVNLFNKRRINKLVGQNVISWYVLDGAIDMDYPRKITIEYNRSDSELVEYTRFEAYYSAEETKISAVDENGAEIEGLAEELNEKLIITNSNQKGLVHIRFSCPPIIEGDSNITVEYTADYENDIKISSSAEINLSGATVLCLTNNRNIVYFSDFLEGYGYFPDNDYVGVGSENEPVTSILSLDSGEIGIFKSNEFYRVSIDVEFIDEEYVVRLEPSIQGFWRGIGCENEFCALQINGDSLIYNGAGVHGIISSASKPVSLRSTNVNRELCAYSENLRKSAFAVSHEGRYYLFIDGKVYIADTRFKTYESNRLDSGYEYEWWIWQGCECRCAYSFDGKLYMGTSDGTVRVFGEGYRDESLVHISASSGEMAYNGSYFSFPDELLVCDGESIDISGAYEKLNKDDITVAFNDKNAYCSLSEEDYSDNYMTVLYEGAEVILLASNGRKLYATVIDFQEESYTVVLQLSTTDYSTTSYNIVKKAESYTARVYDDGIKLVNAFDKDVTFVDYEDIAAVLRRGENVSCEMRTGALDFGKLYSKSLYKLSFTPSEETQGTVEMGYETNLGKQQKSRLVGERFDFGAFDFKNFVFDGAFFKTYIKRVFERNFNYIIFRFASKGDGPFGIENAQAVYSVNNELRSDR